MNIEQVAKEKRRVRVHVLQAFHAELPATLTLDDWLTNIHTFGGLCAYCRQKPYEELDHLIPVVNGGGATANNCVPACKSCNGWKSGIVLEPSSEETLLEAASRMWAYMNTHPSKPKQPFYSEGMQAVSIALPSDLYKQIKCKADEECRPMSRQVLWMIKQAFEVDNQIIAEIEESEE